MKATPCFPGHKCDCVHKGIMDTVTEFTEVKGARKYRRRTVDEKRQIVEETLSSGRSVAEIARSHEVNANQLFKGWTKLRANFYHKRQGYIDAQNYSETLQPMSMTNPK